MKPPGGQRMRIGCISCDTPPGYPSALELLLAAGAPTLRPPYPPECQVDSAFQGCSALSPCGPTLGFRQRGTEVIFRRLRHTPEEGSPPRSGPHGLARPQDRPMTLPMDEGVSGWRAHVKATLVMVKRADDLSLSRVRFPRAFPRRRSCSSTAAWTATQSSPPRR